MQSYGKIRSQPISFPFFALACSDTYIKIATDNGNSPEICRKKGFIRYLFLYNFFSILSFFVFFLLLTSTELAKLAKLNLFY